MTITISEQALLELLQETFESSQHLDTDSFDVIWKYPQPLGQGYIRQIQLHKGLTLEIINYRLHDRLIVELPERPNELTYHFHLFGQHEDKHTVVGNKEYALYGSGLAPKEMNNGPEQHALEVTVCIHPETFCSFIGDLNEQLPTELQPLVRPINQEYYARVAAVTLTMETVLWQILRCPYRGITKRMYLEGKALELASLVLEQESEIQTGGYATSYGDAGRTHRLGDRDIQPLNPRTLERIHYARTLLLQNMDNPPSLVNLARQAKLNEYTLKRGFHQVFGTTVFGYLHDYRLEQARQLLEAGNMKVVKVAETVGFASRSYFATAFKKKFGLNPKEYQQHKGSV